MPGSRWIKVLHLRTRPRRWTRGKSSAWRTPKSTPMIRTFPMPAARSEGMPGTGMVYPSSHSSALTLWQSL